MAGATSGSLAAHGRSAAAESSASLPLLRFFVFEALSRIHSRFLLSLPYSSRFVNESLSMGVERSSLESADAPSDSAAPAVDLRPSVYS